MAIDQTEKRRAISRQGAQLAPAMMDVLYQLDALRRKRDSGGPGESVSLTGSPSSRPAP